VGVLIVDPRLAALDLASMLLVWERWLAEEAVIVRLGECQSEPVEPPLRELLRP
jgi:hypothetical protein